MIHNNIHSIADNARGFAVVCPLTNNRFTATPLQTEWQGGRMFIFVHCPHCDANRYPRGSAQYQSDYPQVHTFEIG